MGADLRAALVASCRNKETETRQDGDGGGEFGLDIVYLNSASEKFSHLALVLIEYLGKPTRDHTRQVAAQTQGKTKT